MCLSLTNISNIFFYTEPQQPTPQKKPTKNHTQQFLIPKLSEGNFCSLPNRTLRRFSKYEPSELNYY